MHLMRVNQAVVLELAIHDHMAHGGELIPSQNKVLAVPFRHLNHNFSLC